MKIRDLRKLLENAVESLFTNQPNIFDFTSETGQTEWNLAHHYANEVWRSLPSFECDLDVVKANIGNKRPDIIFHKRGSNDSNFLVIEVKRDGDSAEIRSDINKIKLYWFGDHLHYKFGATVNLKADKTGSVEIFENS